MATQTSPIDQFLEQLRAQLHTRREEALARTERVRVATDAYLRAIEEDLTSQLAAQVGLDTGHVSQTARAALELRAAVDALPELPPRIEPPAVTAPAPTPTPVPPAPVATPVAAPVTSPPVASAPVAPMASVSMREPVVRELPARESRFDSVLSPGVEGLVRDVRAMNFEALPVDLFRASIEEFAARARHLQEVHAGRSVDEDAIGRIIRKLTALVGERGLSGIYGLSRSHSADWATLAQEAGRKRERIAAGASARAASSLTQRLRIPDALRTQVAKEGSDESEDEDEETGLELPRLRAASRDGAVVIVGGGVRNEKLERVRRMTEIQIEWVPVEHGGTHAVDVLERRIRDGRLCGLIVLQDLMGHKHYEPLVQAARQKGLACAYGGKAGKASLEKALRELESLLTQKAQASAGSS